MPGARKDFHMLDKLCEAKVNELVERFLKVKDIKKSEEHIQSLFTIKMLEYLGWNTDDFKINQGQDVNTGKKPDIILHSSGNTLLVIESKDASKLSMLDGYYQQKEIKLSFVEQLQKYCIAEGVSWGILTNFIEWRVYAIFQNRLYMNRKYAFHKLLWENADKKNYCDLQSAEGSIFLEKLQKHEVLKTLIKAGGLEPKEEKIQNTGPSFTLSIDLGGGHTMSLSNQPVMQPVTLDAETKEIK